MPTFLELRTHVGNEASLSANEIVSLVGGSAGWINEGYKRVCRELKLDRAPFSKALTSGVADYTVGVAPLDIADVTRFLELQVQGTGITTRILERVPDWKIQQARQNTTQLIQTPYWYNLDSYRMLRLYPTPGAGVTLTGVYVFRPAVLVANGDIPSQLPEEYHDLLEHYALWKAYRYDGRMQESQDAERLFRERMMDARKDRNLFGGRLAPLQPYYTRRSLLRGPRDLDRGW